MAHQWSGAVAWRESQSEIGLPGREFMRACCARAEVEGWTSFIYGGKPGSVERLADALLSQFPALKIVGSWTPPFRSLTVSEDDQVVRAINESCAESCLGRAQYTSARALDG